MKKPEAKFLISLALLMVVIFYSMAFLALSYNLNNLQDSVIMHTYINRVALADATKQILNDLIQKSPHLKTFLTEAKTDIEARLLSSKDIQMEIQSTFKRVKNVVLIYGSIFSVIFLVLAFFGVKELTSRYNARIRRMSEELRETNQKLIQKKNELEEANQRLSQLNQAKSALVANVSHELRNPLHTIRMAFSNIAVVLGSSVTERQRQVIDAGSRTTERLSRLVESLLDLSQIEAGRVRMRRQQLDLKELVSEVTFAISPQIEEKKVRLKKDIAENLPLIWGDRDKLSQVLTNLLVNAIKFTPPEGQITVRMSPQQKNVKIEVNDTGRGVEPENLEKIFDMFESFTIGKEQGTGLGLPITKEIVELHQGKIWVDSTLGQGSTFSVTLPIDLRAKPRGDQN